VDVIKDLETLSGPFGGKWAGRGGRITAETGVKDRGSEKEGGDSPCERKERENAADRTNSWESLAASFGSTKRDDTIWKKRA